MIDNPHYVQFIAIDTYEQEKMSGDLYLFGDNNSGQLGMLNISNSYEPR